MKAVHDPSSTAPNETVEKVEAQLWSGQTPSFEKEVVRGFSTVTTVGCPYDLRKTRLATLAALRQPTNRQAV